jgi:polysaccharide biosynthesis protein PslG
MSRRGIAAACAVAAAIAAGSGASTASAVTPNPFYGVVGVHVPNQAELNRVAAAGGGTFRFQLDWKFRERRPGALNWGATDLFFAQAALAGITPLPDLLGVPKWISRDHNRPPLRNARQRAAWSAFLSGLAQRYGSNGTFWAAHPELPQRPVTSWEIWDEPNRAPFFGGKTSARRFVKLLKLSSTALKSADPAAKVVAGGLWPYGSPGGANIASYLKAMYRIPGASGSFDALGLHPFAAKPKGVLRIVAAIRGFMRNHGDGAKPIWVTSFGWVTRGRGGLETPALRTRPKEQARKLTATFRLLAANASSLAIERAIWYSLTDRSRKRAPDFLLARAGLFRVNGKPKPSWFAFAGVAGGVP